jgi:predicted CopG family antitoxin
MAKRTTITLDEDLYQKLVEASVKKYGTTKAMSKIANELLKGALKGEAKIIDLLHSRKIAKTSVREFEEFRRQLSRRLES